MRWKLSFSILVSSIIGFHCQCSRNNGSGSGNTGGGGNGSGQQRQRGLLADDRHVGIMLEKQSLLSFGTAASSNPTIEVDTTATMQNVEGFGFALTGASAYLINHGQR